MLFRSVGNNRVSDEGSIDNEDSIINYNLSQPLQNINNINKESNKGIMFVYEYDSSNGTDFDGRTSNIKWDSPGGRGTKRCINTSSESFADHEIKMRPKDVLDGVRVWVNDTDVDDDLRVIVYKSCLPSFSAGSIDFTVYLAENFVTRLGYDSKFYNLSASYSGRYDSCKIMARVRFGSSNSSCSQSPDITLQKIKAQIIRNDLIFANGFD